MPKPEENVGLGAQNCPERSHSRLFSRIKGSLHKESGQRGLTAARILSISPPSCRKKCPCQTDTHASAADRQTDTQTDRPIYRQIHTHTKTDTSGNCPLQMLTAPSCCQMHGAVGRSNRRMGPWINKSLWPGNSIIAVNKL